MADANVVISGVDDQAADSFFDADERDNETIKLKQRIDSLEHEKSLLVNDNKEMKEQIAKLTAEVESFTSDESEMKQRFMAMEKDVEEAEETKRALQAVSSRAVDLETQVFHLQQDLILAMSEGEEANTLVLELKKVLGEKEVKLEDIKKEKTEMEKVVRELERKLGVLEVKEIEERSKKFRIEEESREKISEKEKEIYENRSKIEQLEKELARKLGLEVQLKESDEKARLMEEKMVELQKELLEAEKMICALKDRTVEAINGIEFQSREKGFMGLEVQWPVLAVGSTSAIVAVAAVLYFCYGKRT